MRWRDNVGTPFVLRSSDASNENNGECDDMQFLQPTSDDTFLQPTFDDAAIQIARLADELSLEQNSQLTDWEGQDLDFENMDQVTPTIASVEPLNPFLVPGSASGVSSIFNSLKDTRDESEPCQSSETFSKIVAHSVVSQTSAHLPAMPWETGPTKSIFSDDAFTVGSLSVPIENALHRSDCQPDELALEISAVTKAVATDTTVYRSLSSRAIKNLADTDFDTRQEELRQLAVDKWLCIVRNHTLSSQVGQQILSQFNLDRVDEARNIINAVIGTRSSTTAISRANAILRYLRWVNDTDEDADPQTEDAAWEYVKHLRSSGAAATTGSSWLSAVRYAIYIFGYDNMLSIANSRRIAGQCDVMYVDKDTLNQAPPFTLSQVKELHRMLDSDSIDPFDRAFVAYVLTGIYTRSRHSDLRKIYRIILDVDEQGGFVELQTRHHKTAKSALKKSIPLPILAPARGVDGSVWPMKVLAAFEGVGLSFNGYLNQPLFKPIDAQGFLCKRGITSEETNDFIELLFPNASLSSHSCKCTCLTWAAKYGLSLPDRNILGRHADATRDTSAVYSRDLCAPAVLSLQKVIDAIRGGSFNPDDTRKGYFPEPVVIEVDQDIKSTNLCTKVEHIEVKDDEPELVDLVSEDEAPREEPSEVLDSESSSSKASSSDCQQPVSEPHPKLVKRRTCIKESFGEAYRNSWSKLVHYAVASPIVAGTCNSVFSCGRQLSQKYELAKDFDPFNMCSLCKKHAARDGALLE